MAFDGVSTAGGGISAKSFLSSLMAVSTRALSGLDSVTYRRLLATEDLDAVVATARDRLRRGAATTAEDEPTRPEDRSADDTRLAMMCDWTTPSLL